MFLERSINQANNIGWIEVVCGSMFSGKTEELIRRVKRAKLAKQKILNKFYPNYKEMGLQQRVRVDQILQQKYGALIDKIGKKSIKIIKKKEILKVKKAIEAKKNA